MKHPSSPVSSAGPHGEYQFTLYVAGNSPNSARAQRHLEQLCHAYLGGRYSIAVVDVLLNPMQALADGIVVTPTLVKRAPGSRRVITGDLGRTPDVLAALDLPFPPPRA
jgi:circadian clock protein KaiB